MHKGTSLAKRLEALAVDDEWAGLVVLLLRDPHLLEGEEGSEDGSSDPDGVLALWWGDDLDLHGAEKKKRIRNLLIRLNDLPWGEGGDLLLHAIGDSWVHGGSSGKDGVGVEVLTDINVALHDGVVRSLVDSGRLHTQEGWLEESLWATEAFVPPLLIHVGASSPIHPSLLAHHLPILRCRRILLSQSFHPCRRIFSRSSCRCWCITPKWS